MESKQQQRSLESLEEAEKTTSSADEEEEEEEEELDEVDDDDDDDGDDGGGKFRVEQRKQIGESPKNEARVKSEALAVAPLSVNDFKSNFAASAHLLSGMITRSVIYIYSCLCVCVCAYACV